MDPKKKKKKKKKKCVEKERVWLAASIVILPSRCDQLSSHVRSYESLPQAVAG
jgi:hypothetical protein